jgi:hypothetical protein
LDKQLSRSHLNQELGIVVFTCCLSYVGSINRRIKIQVSLGMSVKLYLKNTPGRVAQVVEALPSKCEALSSDSSASKIII